MKTRYQIHLVQIFMISVLVSSLRLYSASTGTDACKVFPGSGFGGAGTDTPVWKISVCNPVATVYTYTTLLGCDDNFTASQEGVTWAIVGPDLGLELMVDTSFKSLTDCNSSENSVCVKILPKSGIISGVCPGTLTISATSGGVTRCGSFTINTSECTTQCFLPSNWRALFGVRTGSDSVQGSSTSTIGSVNSIFKLGRNAFGKSVGSIHLFEQYPTNILSQPSALMYNYDTNITGAHVLKDNGAIRQIKSDVGLADVITSNDYKYVINFYPTNQVGPITNTGFYHVFGSPLRTVTVENPDDSGDTTNKLHITNGEGFVSQYEWITNGWELVKGNGFYREFKSTIYTNSDDVKITTMEIRDSETNLLRWEKKFYARSDGQYLLQTNILGDGSDAITNRYYYYTNTVASNMIQKTEMASGNWTYHEYDDSLLETNLCNAFKDQEPTNHIDVSHAIRSFYETSHVSGSGDDGNSMPSSPRMVIEYLLGKEIGRTYFIYKPFEQQEIQSIDNGDAWDATDRLIKITKWNSDTNDSNYQRLESVEYPNGTMAIYDYVVGTQRTNIVKKGESNAGKTDITDGSKTYEVLNDAGFLVCRTVVDIASGITNSHEVYSEFDDDKRPKKTSYLDGTYSWTDYGCCGPITITNKEGTVIKYVQDPMGRRTATIHHDITSSNHVSAAGNILRKIRIGNDQTAITQQTNGYSTAGELFASSDALGNLTAYSQVYTNDKLRYRTTVHPDGSTRSEEYFRDGQLYQITGTSVHPVRYDYGVLQDGGEWRRYSAEIKLDGDGNETSEAITNLFDMVGNLYKTLYSDGAFRESVYNSKNQKIKDIDPDGVTTLYQYNNLGELEYTVIDMDRDGVIDFSGTDRITQHVTQVTTKGAYDVSETKTYIWSTLNSDSSNLVSVAEVSADGVLSWSSANSLTNRTEVHYAGGGNRYVTNTAPDGSYGITHYHHGKIQSETRKDALGTQLSKHTYTYDAHGRPATLTDARNGNTSFTYDDADRKLSITTPAPGTGRKALSTGFEYDFAGRITKTTYADGQSLTNEYHLTGELKSSIGSRSYPVEYAYDAQGRMTNMTTWQDYSNDSGKANTVWKYDGYRGFLTNKLYHGTNGPSYTYTDAGRLRTRLWARGVSTTYETNSAGETIEIDYSDSTSDIMYALDRLGRKVSITDASGSREMTYSDSGLLLSQTYTNGLFDGLSVTNDYNETHQRTTLAFLTNTTSLVFSHSYTYDDASRLESVSDGAYSANYTYLANSPLASQINYRSNTTDRMNTTKKYDYLNRLLSISSVPEDSVSAPISYRYSYNDANQRTKVIHSDGSFWLYNYDSLGQLISGKKYWPDGSLVAGQQSEYEFDDIGNRISIKEGGDQHGGHIRIANYTVNSLNQYTQRDVPGKVDIIGAAKVSATVTVSENSPYRKNEYFWQELTYDNESDPVFESITNVATFVSNSETNIGKIYIPENEELYIYDADGNLLSDGRWDYSWNGENQLVKLQSIADVPTEARRSLDFIYDNIGRRISKTVSNWNAGVWNLDYQKKFVYDEWNMIAKLDRDDNLGQSYLWGADSSGARQGAGGVGGLVAVNIASDGLHFVGYDGNGNVAALINGLDGSISAWYEYDPFGGVVRATSELTSNNYYRYSTKYLDDESQYLYYGHRYYNPSTGRWLNRDPIQSKGGLNIYAFVNNTPITEIDFLGLRPCVWVYGHSFPWTFAGVLPGDDYTPGGGSGGGTSDRVDIVYKRLRRDWYNCTCCPSKKVRIEYRDRVYFKTVTIQHTTIWAANPPGPWPPIGRYAEVIVGLIASVQTWPGTVSPNQAWFERHSALHNPGLGVTGTLATDTGLPKTGFCLF